MGEIHLEQNKTLMDCQLPVHQVRRDKKHHIVWIWSFNSVAFAFSSMKESTSWNSCSPPASKPGGSWKINCGLLLNENWSWTLWIPRYGIKVNDQIREMQKDHWVGTFEVGLICWWGDDESGEWSIKRSAYILPRCKLDLLLYCRPAWAASFYQHSPSR